MRKQAAALKYNINKDNAPEVTAKGNGKIAEKIIEKAKKSGIPLKEDPNLIAALSSLDLYQEIPENLYKAVAEILSELYKINGKSN